MCCANDVARLILRDRDSFVTDWPPSLLRSFIARWRIGCPLPGIAFKSKRGERGVRLKREEAKIMATLRRHQHDQATFDELDNMGQVRSQNGTVSTLEKMTIAHGRRVGMPHAKEAMLQRLEKLKIRIEQL